MSFNGIEAGKPYLSPLCDRASASIKSCGRPEASFVVMRSSFFSVSVNATLDCRSVQLDDTRFAHITYRVVICLSVMKMIVRLTGGR